jgi:hypothetical protein
LRPLGCGARRHLPGKPAKGIALDARTPCRSGAAQRRTTLRARVEWSHVNPQYNPDERFDQVESTLVQLANSQRHLLTAQVLMNDRMARAETAIQKLAETMLALANSQKITEEKIAALSEGQKHTDEKLAALTDIVRQWYERHGNGAASH